MYICIYIQWILCYLSEVLIISLPMLSTSLKNWCQLKEREISLMILAVLIFNQCLLPFGCFFCSHPIPPKCRPTLVHHVARSTSQNSDLGKARSSPTGAPASPRRKRFPTGTLGTRCTLGGTRCTLMWRQTHIILSSRDQQLRKVLGVWLVGDLGAPWLAPDD